MKHLTLLLTTASSRLHAFSGTESDNRANGPGDHNIPPAGGQYGLWSDKARMGFILPKLGF